MVEHAHLPESKQEDLHPGKTGGCKPDLGVDMTSRNFNKVLLDARTSTTCTFDLPKVTLGHDSSTPAERRTQTDFSHNFSEAAAMAKEDPARAAHVMRGMLAIMKSDQIQSMNLEVGGKKTDFNAFVDSMAGLSASDKFVLKTLGKGTDNLTATDFKDMTKFIVEQQREEMEKVYGVDVKAPSVDAILRAHSVAKDSTSRDLQVLSDVLGNSLRAAKDARRDLLADKAFMSNYEQAFNNPYTTEVQRSWSQDLLQRGEISLATIGKGELGFFGTNEVKSVIERAALSANAKERADFVRGRELSTSSPFKLSPEDQSALAYYQRTEAVFQSRGTERERKIWEDELVNGRRTKGFVDEATKDPNSPKADIADAYLHMSREELAQLQDRTAPLRKQADAALEHRTAMDATEAAALVLVSSMHKRLDHDQPGQLGTLTAKEQLAKDAMTSGDPMKRIQLAEAVVRDLDPALREHMAQVSTNPLSAREPATADDRRLIAVLGSLAPVGNPFSPTLAPGVPQDALRRLLKDGRTPLTMYPYEGVEISQSRSVDSLKGVTSYEYIAHLPSAESSALAKRLEDPRQRAILQRTIDNGGKMDDVDRIGLYGMGAGSSYKYLPDVSKLSQKDFEQYQDRFGGNLTEDVLAQVQKENIAAAPGLAAQFDPNISAQQQQIDELKAASRADSTPSAIDQEATLLEKQKLLQEYDEAKAQLPKPVQDRLNELSRRFADAHGQSQNDEEKQQAAMKDLAILLAGFAVEPAISGLFKVASLARARVAAILGETSESAASAELLGGSKLAESAKDLRESPIPEVFEPRIPIGNRRDLLQYAKGLDIDAIPLAAPASQAQFYRDASLLAGKWKFSPLDADKTAGDFLSQKVNYESAIKYGLMPAEAGTPPHIARFFGVDKGELSGSLADYENPATALARLQGHPELLEKARTYFETKAAAEKLSLDAAAEGLISKDMPLSQAMEALDSKSGDILESPIVQSRLSQIRELLDKSILQPNGLPPASIKFEFGLNGPGYYLSKDATIYADAALLRELGGKPEDTGFLLSLLRHEAVHHEQFVTQIREIADQLHIGKLAPSGQEADEQVAQVQREYLRQVTGSVPRNSSELGSHLEPQPIERILQLRNGEPLTAKQSIRARDLLEDSSTYRGLTSFEALKAKYKPLSEIVERLRDPDPARARDQLTMLMRNLVGENGEFNHEYSARLFGTRVPPLPVQAVFNAWKNGVPLAESNAVHTVHDAVFNYLTIVNTQMDQQWNRYLGSRIEREAYYVDHDFYLDFISHHH
jgi:hypothetical protein